MGIKWKPRSLSAELSTASAEMVGVIYVMYELCSAVKCTRQSDIWCLSLISDKQQYNVQANKMVCDNDNNDYNILIITRLVQKKHEIDKYKYISLRIIRLIISWRDKMSYTCELKLYFRKCKKIFSQTDSLILKPEVTAWSVALRQLHTNLRLKQPLNVYFETFSLISWIIGFRFDLKPHIFSWKH